MLALDILAAALIAVTGPAPAVAAPLQQQCPSERALFSQHGYNPTSIVFRNESRRTIRVYWLDYNGMRTAYGSIAPGRTASFDTYATHPWVVTDRNGNCLQVVFAETGMTYTHR